jgi:hypothetical protein
MIKNQKVFIIMLRYITVLATGFLRGAKPMDKDQDHLLEEYEHNGDGDEDDDEFVEFEELDDDEDDDVDWDSEDEGKEADPKNPMGLKVDPDKPIPVRKPKSAKTAMAGISKSDDPEREEKIRKDRIESAKRYESLRLYEDAVKYYTMAGELEEAERVRGIMEKLYLKKAKEFEAKGGMDEAAHLYDILKMKEDAARCRSQSTIPKMPQIDDEEPTSGAIAAFRPMNDPSIAITDPDQSPYIAAGQEHAQEVPVKKPKEKQKAFSVCPYCGEDIDLPKPPKFCPYCREPFT